MMRLPRAARPLFAARTARRATTGAPAANARWRRRPFSSGSSGADDAAATAAPAVDAAALAAARDALTPHARALLEAYERVKRAPAE